MERNIWLNITGGTDCHWSRNIDIAALTFMGRP